MGISIAQAQKSVRLFNAKLFGVELRPTHTPGLFRKYLEEVEELGDALNIESDAAEEAADNLIMLLAVCQAERINLEAAFAAKMAKNRDRKWEQKDGLWSHVKESEGS